ncbi:unnamed protein product [Spirodela intermedia]|uniref:Uncharacterized protein n=1 Tax=Spirodela intermedia TaxID=51605 RepID=A0A7I8IIY8_SPIIN|nr:unnamed protein product [Spirodela intermedia]CAA6657837.1 unnamed protein product [Spirodela intermedia]
MVKSVVGEETRLQFAENRLFQSNLLAQSGLDRGFVYDLVPTAPTDDGRLPCSLPEIVGGSGRDDKRKGSKGGGGKSPAEAPAPLIIDVDWVAEHARQVARLLLGGMHVVGIYVWTSESSFKASSLVLWQTVREVAQATPFYENDPQERLLVHASYSPRRWTCRNCILASTNVSTNLRPCDFKWGKLLGSLQLFRCIYKFDQRLPIIGGPKNEAFKDVLREAISDQRKELKNCTKALIDGKLVNEDLQCILEGTHEVELLLPFMNKVSSYAFKEEEIVGLLVFTGVIHASAYLCPKETVSEAISEVKEDIINSLQSRLEIICEEAGLTDSSVSSSIESEKETSFDGVNCQSILNMLKFNCTLSFPRRVLIPWLGNVFVCDYLQPSETLEVLGSHCGEMMAMESPIDSKSVLEVEKEVASLTIRSFWDAALGRSAPLADCSGRHGADKGRVAVNRKVAARAL